MLDVLFLFTQPGSYKAFQGFSKNLDCSYEFVNIGDLCQFEGATNLTLNELRDYLTIRKPKLVVTGTSSFPEVDNLAWKEVHTLEIPLFPFIDQWVNLKDRFNEGSKNYIEKVLVPDSFTEEAMKNYHGLESFIVGHPSLVGELSNSHKKQKIDTVVFLTEPISLYKDPLYLDDEVVEEFLLAQRLKETVESVGLNFALRPHPREGEKKYHQFKIGEREFQGNTLYLGIASILVIELLVKGFNACFIKVGGIERYSSIHSVFEMVKVIKSKDELVELLSTEGSGLDFSAESQALTEKYSISPFKSFISTRNSPS